jgi:aspartyl/asparaginyl beta-hydroxylase (cupin superfamily)
MSVHKIWFSLFDLSFNYKGSEEAFQSPTIFSWANEFEENYEGIYLELQHYLASNAPKPYFKSSMVDTSKGYRTISLRWWDLEFRKNRKYFPITSAIMLKYPEITTLSFNFLGPDSKIVPHCGDTNSIYRCHFGLKVPAGLPLCGIKVKDQERRWEQGKWLVFMDAFVHETFNTTRGERIILLMDVIRPEYIAKRTWITSVVLTSLFLQKRATIFTFIYKWPQWLVNGIAILLIPFSYLTRKLANLFRIY